MTETEATSRAWADYERPSVAVDTAVLTATQDDLFVVLTAVHGDQRLPGTFLQPGEPLTAAVQRSLATKLGLHGLDAQQLHVFDDPSRDDRGWVLSVAHFAVVPYQQASETEGGLVTPVSEARSLPFDHDRIVARAIEQLRSEYDRVADPRRLLGDSFTLRDLQRLHQAIAGTPLRRETFRKRMESQLMATNEHVRGVIGKPPRVYRHPEP